MSTISVPTITTANVLPEEIGNNVSEEQTDMRIMHHVQSINGVADFSEEAVEAGLKDDINPLIDDNQLNVLNGGRILFATDEWFASADNLLKETEPEFDPDAYCEQGKVMDGWESRRRREAGHDWCIIQLPKRSEAISRIYVDTAYFTGNHAPSISVQAADLSKSQEMDLANQFPGALGRLLHGCVQGTGMTPSEVEQAEQACQAVEWKELLPRTHLNPGYPDTRYHSFPVMFDGSVTHIRLNYFPDGGVARLRLYGRVASSQPKPATTPLYMPPCPLCKVVPHTSKQPLPSSETYEYPELTRGGDGIVCSNQHYGVPSNLLKPCLGRDMGDGWETARHPERPGILHKNKDGLVDSNLSDWCILQLASPASTVHRIILDTKHFRGNYPESVQVEGCYAGDDQQYGDWKVLIPRSRMSPDAEHCYDFSPDQNENNTHTMISHVRVTIFPDGGLSRVRVYGQPM